MMDNYQKNLAKDLIIRKEKLQALINEQGADACILATNANIFYATGKVYLGYYYLPISGNPIHFVKRPNDIDFDNTVYIRKPEQIIEELQKRGLKTPERLLLETDSISYNECSRIIASLNHPEIISASAPVRNVRSIKTGFEITQIRECAKIHEDVYKMIPTLFSYGMTDLDLQIEIERQMRLHGSIGIFRTYGENMDIFMGSLLAGDNAGTPSPFDFALGGEGVSPVLPIGVSGNKIEKGQTFMVDMAGNYRPWMTDISRVYSVGKTSETLIKRIRYPSA